MGRIEEVREANREVQRLEQALGQARAKALTLKPKVEEAKQGADRCVSIRDLSKENLEYLKKGDIILMKDYGDMLHHYRNNKAQAIKYKNEVLMYSKMLETAQTEIVFLEKILEAAKRVAGQTAAILPFER